MDRVACLGRFLALVGSEAAPIIAKVGLARARGRVPSHSSRPGFVIGDEMLRRRLLLRLALALEDGGSAPATDLDLGSGDGRRPGRIVTPGQVVLVAGAGGVFVFVTENGQRLGPANEEGIRMVAAWLAAASRTLECGRACGSARCTRVTRFLGR